MWKWIGTALILSSIIVVQACAPKSELECGFQQNTYGERISWQANLPAKMFVHSSVPDSVIPAILAAEDTLNKAAGRKVLNIITSPRVGGPAAPHQDGSNVIYFMQNWEESKASEQGRTSLYVLGDLIKEADLRINAFNFSFYWKNVTLTTAAKEERKSSAPINIEALVLHELGHVLGLKHKDTDSSVMATYLQSGDDRTSLASVDQLNLQCEY